jgi:DNA-directed RNA polymerase specialized sigma24 family protein
MADADRSRRDEELFMADADRSRRDEELFMADAGLCMRDALLFVREPPVKQGDPVGRVDQEHRRTGDPLAHVDDRTPREADSPGRLARVASRIEGAAAAKRCLEADVHLRRKILRHAYSLTGNLDEAKDLAQQAIARAIDPDGSPWDPDAQPNLVLHVGSLMNSAASNQRRARVRHPTTTYDPALHDGADPATDPEERVAQAEDVARLERLLDRLLVQLAGDAVALGKIQLMRAGVDDAEEQARALRCDVKDIYRANERIRYHVALVKASDRAGEIAGGPRRERRPGAAGPPGVEP